MPASFWIDVSLVFQWRGNLTGIPRTVVEIVDFYRACNPGSVRFCRYHPAGLGFTEVSHEELQRELILLRSHRGAFATSESEGKRRGAVGTRLTMSARAKVKSLLRRIFGLAPHSIKLELKDSFWATLTVFRNARSI